MSEESAATGGGADPGGANVVIRDARPGDALAMAELLTVLGYPSTAAQVEQRLAQRLVSPGDAVFVAETDGRVVGFLSFHCTPLLHREGFLGRITAMVVAGDCREKGVGRRLVEVAEEFGWGRGCEYIEVTSRDQRAGAHAFYERVGYHVDCRRFLKHRTPSGLRAEGPTQASPG